MITPANLGIFAHIATAKGDSGRDTLQLSSDGRCTHVGGKYYSANLLGRLFRKESNKVENNNIREQLLENLAKTFGFEGAVREGNRCRFSRDLMDRLERQLGKDIFKRGDFGIDENGYVTSGSPLTERRITAIVNRVHDLNSTAQAESKLKGAATLLESLLSQSWLELDGNSSLSPLEMAKFVAEFNHLGGDVEQIHTLGHVKALIERTTGRTCHVMGSKNGEMDTSLLEGNVIRARNLVEYLKDAKDAAEIFLAAHPRGPRVSMREAVRASAQNKCEAIIEAVRTEALTQVVKIENVQLPDASLKIMSDCLPNGMDEKCVEFLNEHANDGNDANTFNLLVKLLKGESCKETDALLGAQSFRKDAKRGLALTINNRVVHSAWEEPNDERIKDVARELLAFFTVGEKLQATKLYQFIRIFNQNAMSALNMGAVYRREQNGVCPSNPTGAVPFNVPGCKGGENGFFYSLSKVGDEFHVMIRERKSGKPGIAFSDKAYYDMVQEDRLPDNVVKEVTFEQTSEVVLSDTLKEFKVTRSSVSETCSPL